MKTKRYAGPRRSWGGHALRTALAAAAALGLLALLTFVAGCGGHEARTLPVRTALDEGRPRAAIEHLNEELDVKSDADLPKDLQGDNALLVLDRATIQQSLAQYKLSERDFQASDKAIDMLDLAHNAGDSIGQYVFSDSAGRYVAPPYEKLLVNTLNMINYLETKDLEGARIEARRLAVMERYVKDQLQEHDNAILGLGGFLAGLAFEKSGDADEALRWYDESLAFSGFGPLSGPIARLVSAGATYSSPRIKAAAQAGGSEPPLREDEGEIVLVLGYGRVPHKIAQRVPIGLALTYVSGAISPNDAATANRLAAQGLVTWVNYPSLAPEQGQYALPTANLDGRWVQLEQAVNVSSQVRAEWKKIEGKIIVSAITRMVARVVAGEAIRKAGNDSLFSVLLSLGTQATLTALDTPDTRSWETLPARVAIARVRVPAGSHVLRLDARGVSRTMKVDVPKGGWALASLMALR